MASTEGQILKIARLIDEEVRDYHKDWQPGKWNPQAGQFLVYGFETTIGFNNSVALCGQIETAYKAGKNVEKVAAEFFAALLKERKVK